jgi:phage baseplate assembly protein W
VTATQARLGSGWAFPVQPRSTGGDLAYAAGAEKVREAILLVLRTEPGERVMRPTFGCGLRRFLAEPNTVATRARLVQQVTAAIEAWEPRVRLREVTATGSAEDPALVLLTIHYEHARDAGPGLLVYPFYLEG